MTQLLKTTSLLAIAAMAGVAMASASASAADLGGNCCTDLEERVAELEATTVRKGNRKVSLQIYGQISETILFWDDGRERNVYVQENNATKNLLGFQGNAKVTSDWSAGFKVELQVRAYRSSSANQLSLGANNGVTITTYNTQSISLRDASFYLDSKTYGRVTVGRTSDAAVGTGGINLANPDGFQANGGFFGFSNGGFFLRRSGTAGNAGLSGLTWQNFAWVRNGDGPNPFDYAQTASQIKYTSPFFLGNTKSSGFQFSSSWGEDDMWAVALRYAEELGAIRVAAGIGYEDWRDLNRTSCANTSQVAAGGLTGSASLAPGVAGGSSNVSCHAYQASASAMHTPTGLYVSGGGAMLTDNNRQAALNQTLNGNANNIGGRGIKSDNNDGYWWLQAGWEAKLNPLGKTTFYGTYSQFNMGTGVANNAIQTVAATDQLNSLGATAYIAGTQTRSWGLGVTQAVDAAAMNLYLGYLNMQTDGQLGTANGANSTNTGTQRARTNSIDGMQMLYTGATIKF